MIMDVAAMRNNPSTTPCAQRSHHANHHHSTTLTRGAFSLAYVLLITLCLLKKNLNVQMHLK